MRFSLGILRASVLILARCMSQTGERLRSSGKDTALAWCRFDFSSRLSEAGYHVAHAGLEVAL